MTTRSSVRSRRRLSERVMERIAAIQYNDYVGRIGVGRIYNGQIKSGQQVTIVKREGERIKSKVPQLQVFDGFGDLWVVGR